MVQFTRLSIRNFKRFSGEHHIPLNGDGRVTVIAAKNGLGKTTIMDAIHVSLYGRKGFSHLYPEKEFFDWISKAYSVDADDSGMTSLSLEMQDQVLGKIRITRTYWMMDEPQGGISEEAGITIDGKPLQRLPGETRAGLAERWIEDYIPHAAMSRFLVDGERLSHLDPKRIDGDIVGGIDDATGIGLLHRMRKHLNTAKRATLRSLAPDGQADSINTLLEMQGEFQGDLESKNDDLQAVEDRSEHCSIRIAEIQDDIEKLTKEGGSENVQLRMDYAIRQSELTGSRRELHHHLMESLPFVVAGLPAELSNWDLEAVLESKRSSQKAEEHMEFLNSVIEDSDVGRRTASKLVQTGSRMVELNKEEGPESPLSDLEIKSIEKLVKRHAELGMSDASERVIECTEEAMSRLMKFESTERELRKITAGMGISDKAEELKELAKETGSLQAKTALLKGEISQKETDIRDIEKRIDDIRQREDSDSLLNRRISRIDDLLSLTELVTQSVRRSFAEPLESSFREGFELLSRKSGRLQDISINTNDYNTILSMRGFEGNWLDRDLSATERQHVGLALVFALRRASTEWALPLPVIIDTPTSRMDSEHKSWSVTRFYPQLSQQVVVLATSDDLAGGLFEELEESGVLGAQILVQEISENSVEAITSDLGAFFGGA
tara:strand:- start:1289 stop:3286 length:1998 start_codon:yes stop_codon:yes gene_type:complete